MIHSLCVTNSFPSKESRILAPVTPTWKSHYTGAEIRRIVVQSQPSPTKLFERPYLKNTHHKKGLVEWLKV
jgi:hypothetical protein